MRLKSYSAIGMAEAMQLVRKELGDDAIIVSTQRDPNGPGVTITAALESIEGDDAIARILAGGAKPLVSDALRDSLTYHGVPARLSERLVNAARLVESDDPTMACAASLDATYAFAPLPDRSAPRPFLLVGPPGGGKTITVAKLAARSALKRRRVGIVTTDTVRAGGVEQLVAFTRILEIELKIARGPEALKRVLAELAPASDIIFIDTPGLNPFSERDMAYLSDLASASDVEPILAFPAGGDPAEATEIGEAYAAIGATRLLATRLDAARRLGSVLACADSGQLMFSEVTVSPHVAGGLTPINPVSLARLLVPQEDHADHQANILPEAVS